MRKKLIEYIGDLVKAVYLRVFDEKPGPAVTQFIKNMGYGFFGFGLAKMVGLVLQVYIGRVVGPTEYGKYSIIYSLAQFLYLPIAAINIAFVKYLSERGSEELKQTILSTGLILSLIIMVPGLCGYLLFSSTLSGIIKVPQMYIYAAILLSFSLICWMVSKQICQGLHMMKKVSFIEIVRSILLICLIPLLFHIYGKNAQTAILALGVAFFSSSWLILPELRQYFRLTLDTDWMWKLLSYGKYSSLVAVFTVTLTYIDRFLINLFLGVRSVGIYEAYFFSTVIVVKSIMVAFTTVFFPESSRGDKRKIRVKISRILRYTPIVYFCLLLISLMIIKLYGPQYPIIPSLFVILPLASTLILVYLIYESYTASLGTQGIKTSFYTLLLAAVVNFVLNIILIPTLGILGAAISMLIAYSIALPLLIVRSGKVLETIKS